jgi:hypothetical protein
MAIEKREVDVITCDACGKEGYLDEGEMPVGWYVGDVIFHHEGGGSGGEWSACKSAHIKQAVIEAVNREY